MLRLGLLLHSILPTHHRRPQNPRIHFPNHRLMVLFHPPCFPVSRNSGFFSTNRLVKVCVGLDNLSLGGEAEKVTLLRTLKESASSFPPEFASFRIHPSLVTTLEYGGASTIVPLVLQFGKNVSPDEHMNIILGPLIRLFASPDRGTWMALLDNLSEYAEKLDKKVVVDKVWPNIVCDLSL
ncbi:hypothetical protein OG21DRAFT_911710 [Imleria badia]|nr:hypothetical protein OG21DRAFT_911710 [Imleria badia]